jgi:cysteine desulfurase / selenocysteine lyase
MFDKSNAVFPVKEKFLFLGHCSISPLYRNTVRTIQNYGEDISHNGIVSLPKFFDVLPEFHKNGGKLFKTSPSTISYVHNTAEALCQIANGYPFKEGDQVISYVHEYPSNHYPWRLQQRRGVELILLSDCDPLGNLGDIEKPRGWSMEELASKVTPRTRVIALSHVQFSSGYAADLEELGAFCHERNIDLIVDCAQSLGCLPVYPEKWHISAVAASGWKWLMGSLGTGILYTSDAFREKLEITMAGPGLMRQGLDYLDHSWNPHEDGRCFEYSTLPWDHVAGFNTLLSEIFLRYSAEHIRAEVFRLQDIFLQNLEPQLTILTFPDNHRSGILAGLPKDSRGVDAQFLVQKMSEAGLVVTAPIGYLRFAPHFYMEDKQMVDAAHIVNEVCSGK